MAEVTGLEQFDHTSGIMVSSQPAQEFVDTLASSDDQSTPCFCKLFCPWQKIFQIWENKSFCDVNLIGSDCNAIAVNGLVLSMLSAGIGARLAPMYQDQRANILVPSATGAELENFFNFLFHKEFLSSDGDLEVMRALAGKLEIDEKFLPQASRMESKNHEVHSGAKIDQVQSDFMQADVKSSSAKELSHSTLSVNEETDTNPFNFSPELTESANVSLDDFSSNFSESNPDFSSPFHSGKCLETFSSFPPASDADRESEARLVNNSFTQHSRPVESDIVIPWDMCENLICSDVETITASPTECPVNKMCKDNKNNSNGRLNTDHGFVSEQLASYTGQASVVSNVEQKCSGWDHQPSDLNCEFPEHRHEGEIENSDIVEEDNMEPFSAHAPIFSSSNYSGSYITVDKSVIDSLPKVDINNLAEFLTQGNVQFSVEQNDNALPQPSPVCGYSCDQCDKNFTHESLLKVHQAVHSEDRPFSCSDCNMSFKLRHHLVNHQKKHKSKGFICGSCAKAYATLKDLQNHQKLHNLQKHYQVCRICQRCFNNMSALRNHYVYIHKQTIKGEALSEHTCPYCQKVIRGRPIFTAHLRRHKKQFTCTQCGKIFYNRKDLKQHISFYHLLNNDTSQDPLEELNISKYECLQCHVTFLSKARLKCHMEAVHLKVHRFHCQVEGCDYGSYWKTDVEVHQKVHKNQLQGKHVDMKKIQKPTLHYCELCGHAFASRKSLGKHVIRVHQMKK